ncbi:MAG: GNAT family N-acetyltransferase [Oscillospiraceae bacterium]|jgi:RimJ/RimL family protein N-acetyltransferase|nr:GNAT family N-acetyltransferase [Oscillospiraceae bacterium]
MRYFPKIIGERIYLSPINADDAEIYTKWLNDPAVADHLGQYRNAITLATEKKALENMVSGGQNYAIVLKDGDELLGNISLMEVEHIHRRATLGLFIGEAGRRGKGYGTEAIRLILGYGFNTLNLHNIMLTVHADNPQGLACYKKVGFTEIGRRRGARIKDGKQIDLIYMDILSTEFGG